MSNLSQDLRRQLRQKRKQLSLTEQRRAAYAINTQLIQSKLLQGSQRIAGYWATEGEIDLHLFFQWVWIQNKTSYLPVVLEDRLIFSQYHPESSLKINQWGIPEPAISSQTIEAMQLEVVLVPLVAFDIKGNRLGRGAGYYDRRFAFLNNTSRPKSPYLIGIAYEWQAVSQLEATSWDVSLDAIVTDIRWIEVSP